MKITFFDYIKPYLKHPSLVIYAFLDVVNNAKQKRFLKNKFAAYKYEEKKYYDIIVKSGYDYYIQENKYKYSIYNPMIVVWHELERIFDNGTGVAAIRRMGIIGINIVITNDNR